MKKGLKRFLIFWTLLIIVYAEIFVLLDEDMIREVHENVPPLMVIGSTLGIFDSTYLEDKDYEVKKNIRTNLQKYLQWKNKNSGEDGVNTFNVDQEEDYIKLYSPTFTFDGTVSDTIRSIDIILIHKGREVNKKRSVDVDSDGGWQYLVQVSNEMLFPGVNTYRFEATFEGGQRITREFTLEVDFQRIEIGDSVLYFDPQFLPDGTSEDILRSSVDLDGDEIHTITWGCDETDPKPPILMEHDVQFKEIPACLTFSLKKEYLLWFTPAGTRENGYLFDIHAPELGVIRKGYPLYRSWLGKMYYTMIFRDQEENRLETLFAKGESDSYVMRIERFDVLTGDKELEIVVTDGNQFVAETAKEKMYVYLYKPWSQYTSLIFPGTRYQFFLKSWGDSWKKMNEGSLYTLPIGIYAPRKGYASTFTFRVTLDGDTVYIDDSLKITTFDIKNMGTTLDVVEREDPLNDPSLCVNADIGLHKDLIANQHLGLGIYDIPYLVGRGWYASSIKVFHNGKTTGSTPDQHYKGYMHHRLSTDRNNYERGENTYTVKAYDQWGNEICSKSVREQVDR